MQKRTIQISLSELFEGYNNDIENLHNPDWEIRAYKKKLIVKPEYQREYKCEDKTTLQEELMDSIIYDLELPKFIWIEKENGDYEVLFELLDGQQRTRMICDFMNNLYAIKHDGKNKFFDRLPNEIQNKIKRYIIDITILSDISKEDIIKQFKRLNKNQTMIKRQEELNAAHTGHWLGWVKKYFSRKHNSEASGYSPLNEPIHYFLAGNPEDQDYLETVLKWYSNHVYQLDYGKYDIEKYMDEKYKDDDHAEKNANALLQYFKEVMEWFGGVFAEYHSSMKGLDIGFLYNKYHKQKIDKKAIHRKFDTLIGNVENASYTDNGIFKYLFSNRHEDLYKREFTKKMKSIKWIEQGKKCNSCQKELKEKDIIGHHKKPFNKNGPTTVENLEILCKECHKEKHNY